MGERGRLWCALRTAGLVTVVVAAGAALMGGIILGTGSALGSVLGTGMFRSVLPTGRGGGGGGGGWRRRMKSFVAGRRTGLEAGAVARSEGGRLSS